MKIFWQFVMKIAKWKVKGDFPFEVKKKVIIVVPHTTNWDFPLGLMIRGSVGFTSNYLGKNSLFKFPFGWFFRATGGIPVDRKSSQNLVSQVVEEVNKRDSFTLSLAPEGTRSSVNKWRSGFYYIAYQAKIPILLCKLDWKKREARFLDPLFIPSGDFEKDLPVLKSRFAKE